MYTIKTWIDRLLASICIVLCGFLTVAVTWQVVGRFLFNSAGAISEELAKIMFVWLVLLGAALLFGERGHMSIEIFVDAVASPRRKKILQIITNALILCFVAGILLFGGIDAVQRTMRQTNAAIPFIRTGQIYMALPLCGAFSVYYCLYNIWTDARALTRDAKKAPVGEED